MTTIGRWLFAVAAIALGVEGLVFGVFARPWQQVSETLPAYHQLAYAAAVAFLVFGVALAVPRVAGVGGAGLGALFGIFALLWAARVVHAPTVVAMWSGFAEATVLVIGAVIAAASSTVLSPNNGIRLLVGVRLAFGLCLLAFAAAHFVYIPETSAMVPAYMPLGNVFWAYATGAAHGVAGLALIAGVAVVTATRLVAVMFAGFAVLVWLPMVVAGPSDAFNWHGNAVNLGLFAAALLVAALLSRQRELEKRQ